MLVLLCEIIELHPGDENMSIVVVNIVIEIQIANTLDLYVCVFHSQVFAIKLHF